MSIDTYPTPADVTLGTMSTQNANAVSITGGTISVPANGSSGGYTATDAGAGTQVGFRSLVTAGANKYNVLADGTAANTFIGPVGIGTSGPSYPLDVMGNVRLDGFIGIKTIPSAGVDVQIDYAKGSNVYGMWMHQTADTGAGNPIVFTNAAQTVIGSISTTGSATAYNTTSDQRLKHAIETLVGALGVVQQLNPVRFCWNADNSPGVGFRADELQQIIPEAVTGEPDAVNDDGSIRPQQVDLSKLVPWLTAAVQELAAQVQTLTARVAQLEGTL